MVYKVFLHPKANSFLENADDELQNRIRKKLYILSHRPEKGERLKQSDFWLLRIGDYRAIYEINRDNNQVIVLFCTNELFSRSLALQAKAYSLSLS